MSAIRFPQYFYGRFVRWSLSSCVIAVACGCVVAPRATARAQHDATTLDLPTPASDAMDVRDGMDALDAGDVGDVGTAFDRPNPFDVTDVDTASDSEDSPTADATTVDADSLDVRDSPDSPDSQDAAAADASDVLSADSLSPCPGAGEVRIAGTSKFVLPGTVASLTFSTSGVGGESRMIDIDRSGNFQLCIPRGNSNFTADLTSIRQVCTLTIPSTGTLPAGSDFPLEIRCVIATEQLVTAAQSAAFYLPNTGSNGWYNPNEPGMDNLWVHDPNAQLPVITMDLERPASVLLAVHTPAVTVGAVPGAFQTNVVELAIRDTVTNQVYGRAVIGHSQHSFGRQMSSISVAALSAGPHRFIPVWRTWFVGRVEPAQAPFVANTFNEEPALQIRMSATVLDSLGSHVSTQTAQWTPNPMTESRLPDLDPAMPTRWTVPGTATTIRSPANSAVFVTFQAPQTTASPRWELLSDNTQLAMTAGYYGGLPFPNSLIGIQLNNADSTNTFSAVLSRYPNSADPHSGPRGEEPVHLGMPFNDVLPGANIALTQSHFSSTLFRPNARVYGQSVVGAMTYPVGNYQELVPSPANTGTPLGRIRVRLSVGRQLWLYSQLSSIGFQTADTGSPYTYGQLQIIRVPHGAMLPAANTTVLATSSFGSGCRWDAQSHTFPVLAQVPPGDWDFVLVVRAGIAPGFAVAMPTNHLLDWPNDGFQRGRINFGAIVLE